MERSRKEKSTNDDDGTRKEQGFNQTNGPPTPCLECNKTFQTVEERMLHYQSRHPQEYCSVCHAIFGSVEEKVLHVRTSFGHHRCKHCEKVLYFLDLSTHYRDQHPLVYCSLCFTTFNSVEERNTHVRTSPGHHCCQHCEEILDSKFLRMHHQVHHPLLYCFACDIILNSVEDKNTHLRTSSKHHCCQHCEDLREHLSEKSLRLHQRVRHPTLYCSLCDILFPSDDKSFAHKRDCHHFCNGCHQDFFSALHLTLHRQTCEKLNPPKNEERSKPKPKASMPRNHYVTLGISPDSSHEHVVKAAKEMRIKVHPDRLKKGGGFTKEQERAIDLEAKLVGQAADVLSDPLTRRTYDTELRS